MTRFKICGLREVEHATTAADAGADFLGFVFVPGVRRQLSQQRARDIIEEYRRLKGKSGPRLVGLFANQPLDEVNHIVSRCGLDLAQLCGDESPEYWRQVDAPVIRQIKVRDDGLTNETVADVIRRVDEVVSHDCIALLDKRETGQLGGTGRSFDWSIAREAGKHYDFVLAGGLSPDNVGRAIASASPWGVDVSSGVETNGIKDMKKIAAFAEEVRRSDARKLESPVTNPHQTG